VDRMKMFWAGLICAGLLAQIASADGIAYPRFSPLPVLKDSGKTNEDPQNLSVAFGTAMPVVAADAEHVSVALDDGRTARLRRQDVMIPSKAIHAIQGPSFAIDGRVRLSFWDSPLRAQGFLRDGPSAQTRPILVEAGIQGMPALLPISDRLEATSRTGRSIWIAEGLIPMVDEALPLAAQNRSGSMPPVALHVIVDGSGYTRAFSEQRLEDLSRRLDGEIDGLEGTLHLTRTILLDSGKPLGPETVALSDLRRRLPDAATGRATANGLSSALTEALSKLSIKIKTDADAGRASIILVLIGPGLRVDDLETASFSTAAAALQEQARQGVRIGLLAGSATPEPSDVPARLLSSLGAGLPGAVVRFDADLAKETAALSAGIHQRDSASELSSLCKIAQEKAVPCLSGPGPDNLAAFLPRPTDKPLEWFSLPLWFVVDGNTLMFAETVLPETQAQDSPEMIATLQRQVAMLQTQVETTQRQLALREADLLERSASTRGNREAQALETRLTSETRVLRDALRKAEAALAGREQDLAKAEEAWRKADRRLTTTEATLDDERALRMGLEQERDALRKEQKEINQALSQAQAAAKQQEILLRAAEDAATAASVEVAELKRDLQQAEKTSRTLTERLGTRDEEVAALTAQLTAAASEQAELITRAARLEASLDQTTRRLTAVETALDSERDGHRLTRETLANTEQALANTKADALRLEAALQDADTRRAELAKAIRQQDATLADLRKELAANTDSTRRFEADLAGRQAEIARLETALSETAAGAARDGETLRRTQAKVAELEAARLAQAELFAAQEKAAQGTITGMQSRLAEAETMLGKLNTVATERERALAEAQDKLASRNTEIASLVGHRETLEAALASADAQIAELKTIAAAQEARLGDVDGMLAQFAQASRTDSAGRPTAESDTLKRILEHYSQSLALAEAQNAELRKAQEDLRAELLALQAQARSLQGQHEAEREQERLRHAMELATRGEDSDLAHQTAMREMAAMAGVLGDLGVLLGLEAALPRQDGENAVNWAQRLVANPAVLQSRLEAWASELRSLVAERDAFGAETIALRDALKKATGLAEENRQLAELLESTRRVMVERDAAHKAEVSKLQSKVAMTPAKAAPPARKAPQSRPQTRPAAPAAPVPTVEALPGSPLQRQTAGAAVQTGAGFFGN